MDYSIKINEFVGPLDLLLHLIKQSNMDILDIEINEITKQYLDYINKMEELNINVAASYIVMAAELMEIKSKSLLPKTTEEVEEEDYSKNTIGLQARMMSRALRKITSVIGRYKAVVIFTNQTREKIGVMYGNPECVTPDTMVEVEIG